MPKTTAAEALPWAQANWKYQGLLPVFRARFEAHHQQKEAELRKLAAKRPYVLALIFVVAFAFGDRGCAVLTYDDPIPFGHYVAGAILAAIAVVIGWMFFDPGAEDEVRRRLDAFFDRLFEDAHPQSPLAIAVVGNPEAAVQPWKKATSPYSAAAKRYFRYCMQRTSFALPNGGQAHVELWRAVKFKGASTMRDARQLRVALRFPGACQPPTAERLGRLPPPTSAWTFRAFDEADGGLRVLAEAVGSPTMVQEAELAHLLRWLREGWRDRA